MAVNHDTAIFPSAQEQLRSGFTDLFFFNPKSKFRALIPGCGLNAGIPAKVLISREVLCPQHCREGTLILFIFSDIKTQVKVK